MHGGRCSDRRLPAASNLEWERWVGMLSVYRFGIFSISTTPEFPWAGMMTT